MFSAPVSAAEAQRLTRAERAAYARDQVIDIARRVWPYVLAGVGIGAAIHNWIPAQWVAATLGDEKWWAVPVAVAIGAPRYADIFGTLPIAEALVDKGVGHDTALAFMMAVTALSLPSLIMLKRAVKMRPARALLRHRHDRDRGHRLPAQRDRPGSRLSEASSIRLKLFEDTRDGHRGIGRWLCELQADGTADRGRYPGSRGSGHRHEGLGHARDHRATA